MTFKLSIVSKPFLNCKKVTLSLAIVWKMTPWASSC